MAKNYVVADARRPLCYYATVAVVKAKYKYCPASPE